MYEILIALEDRYNYYYMGRSPSVYTYRELSCIRVLHPFMYQNALQRQISADICSRLAQFSLLYTLSLRQSLMNTEDPETYAWDLLSADFLSRLSTRPYVSLSRERRLGVEPLNDGANIDARESNSALSTHTHSDSDFDSLFDVNMPGVMTVDEIQVILPELDNWTLKLGGTVLTLRVSWLVLHHREIECSLLTY